MKIIRMISNFRKTKESGLWGEMILDHHQVLSEDDCESLLKNSFRSEDPKISIIGLKGQGNLFETCVIGQAPTVMLLDSNLINKILKKCVLTISAHAGFDKVTTSVLTYLVSLIKHILKRLAQTLHSANQKDFILGRAICEDTVEKTLQFLGFGGVKTIKDYWQADILAKQNRAYNRSLSLNASYNQLITQSPDCTVVN